MTTLKIKTGDEVVVIQGAFKGTFGTVLAVDPKKMTVRVSGIKPIVKYRKKNLSIGRQNGSMSEVSRPIHVSNVMLTVDGVASKVGFRQDETSGSKVRYAKKTGTVLQTPTKTKIVTTSTPDSSKLEATPEASETAKKPRKPALKETTTEVKSTPKKTTKKEKTVTPKE